MRIAVLLLLAACAAAPAKVEQPAPPTPPERPAPAATSEPCLVLGADLETMPASVTGRLVLTQNMLSLTLARPRCVVGLPRASLVTEVAVVTSGPDLRPLAGQRVRIDGNVIGGTNDLGGPAVVLIAKDIARVE